MKRGEDMDLAIKETTFTSRTNPDNSLTVSLLDMSYEAFTNEFERVFKEHIDERKLFLLPLYNTENTGEVLIEGIINWDNLPVRNVSIVFDTKANCIINIVAEYFTFTGISDLAAIEDASYNPCTCATQVVNSSNEMSQYDNSLYVYFSNAVKRYHHTEKTVVIVSLGLYLNRLLPEQTDDSVLPLLIRDGFASKTIDISCFNTGIEDLVTETENSSILNAPAFLCTDENDYLVEKITFYSGRNPNEWKKIVIKLAGDKLKASELAMIAYKATGSKGAVTNSTCFVLNYNKIITNANNEIVISAPVSPNES